MFRGGGKQSRGFSLQLKIQRWRFGVIIVTPATFRWYLVG
jgi:hypothetical protein